jgi:serine/threonine protein kinase
LPGRPSVPRLDLVEIMEERYQIREKIGHGGLGFVYKGFDTRMNREVAIKRIATGDDIKADATEQLNKEAGALASLQHPHIVTVYDVGADEEGPYVVMELITGKTLDELVESAPLTWQDFHELALQSQEALIAAQELGLVHRDLKPGNLMLNWLPSGKFQVKIVDFGLAQLIGQPSMEEIDKADSIFGSIFFMAPEQFERAAVDARTDMYAIGAVYYHSLTGTYPFNGKTGHDVMIAHLEHQVIPLEQVRPDLPRWVCDWVMWHINRNPADRPESARDSLKIFLLNDAPMPQNPIPSPAPASTPTAPPRPRLVIPGASAPTKPAVSDQPKTQSAPKPLTPPAGSKPSVHTGPLEFSPPPEEPVAAPAAQPMAIPVARAVPTTKVQPAKPAAASVPVARATAGPKSVPSAAIAPPAAAPQKHATAKSGNPSASPKRGGPKVGLIISISVSLLVAGFLGMKAFQNSQEKAKFDQLISLADTQGVDQVPVTRSDLELLLETAASEPPLQLRQAISRALLFAKSTDGTDVDAMINDYATRQTTSAQSRSDLLKVLPDRQYRAQMERLKPQN